MNNETQKWLLKAKKEIENKKYPPRYVLFLRASKLKSIHKVKNLYDRLSSNRVLGIPLRFTRALVGVSGTRYKIRILEDRVERLERQIRDMGDYS